MRTKPPNEEEVVIMDPWDRSLAEENLTTHLSFHSWLLLNLSEKAFRLYYLYRHVSMLTGKSIIKLTRKTIQEYFGWGEDRTKSARKELMEAGLIRDIRKRNRQTGHVTWCVGVVGYRLYQDDKGGPAVDLKNNHHRVGYPPGGKPTRPFISPKGDKKTIVPGPPGTGHDLSSVSESGGEEKTSPGYQQRHLNLSKRVLHHQAKQWPNKAHMIRKYNPVNGAVVLRQLETIDGWDWEEIKEAILWAIDDQMFWNQQLISCASLREKKPGRDRNKFMKVHQAWQMAEGTVAPKREKLDNPSPGMLHAIFRYLELEQTEEEEQAVLRSLRSIEKFIITLPKPTKDVMAKKWTAVVIDYAQWLVGQKWALKGRGIGYFSARSNMWSKFFSQYTKRNRIPYPKN